MSAAEIVQEIISTRSRGTPSRGRLLLELGRRFGTTNLETVEASLFAAFMMDGGDYSTEEAFEDWVDGLEDPNSAIQAVAEALAVDPTEPQTGA